MWPLRYIWLALGILAFSTGVASAQAAEGAVTGPTTRISGEGTAKGASLDVAWQAKAKLGVLAGEPVVSVTFMFDVIGGFVTIPELGETGWSHVQTRYESLPQEVREGVRLIDVDLRLVFSNGINRYEVIADVGASGAPGTWSFNVPGSPEWDSLFAANGGYLGENSARGAFSDTLELVDARIESYTLSLYELHGRYLSLFEDRERYRALELANNRLLEGLDRSYGIDASQMKSSWTNAYFISENQSGALDDPQEWRARVDALDEALNKLSSLPQDLRAGTNHAPYDQAVKDLRRLRSAIWDSVRHHESNQINPADREEGYPVDFNLNEFDKRVVERGGTLGMDSITIIWDDINFVNVNLFCAGSYLGIAENQSGRPCGGEVRIFSENERYEETERPVHYIVFPDGLSDTLEDYTLRLYIHRFRNEVPDQTKFRFQIRRGATVAVREGVLTREINASSFEDVSLDGILQK